MTVLRRTRSTAGAESRTDLVEPVRSPQSGSARLLALQALAGNAAVAALLRPLQLSIGTTDDTMDQAGVADSGTTDNEGEPVTPPPYGSAPTWITVIPAPVDGSPGGWRYADWFMGWRQRFGMMNIRCDFEVGTPIRNYKGAVPEAMATTELKFAMDHIAPLIQEMLDAGLLSPTTAPLTARAWLAEDMDKRIPGSRAGAVGSTRTPPSGP